MTTKNFFRTLSVTLIFALLMNVSFAKEKTYTKSNKLKAYLEKHVVFPYSLENKDESGIVAVDFSFDENGKIEINQLNYSDPILKDMVIQKLDALCVDGTEEFGGNSYIYKFEFINE